MALAAGALMGGCAASGGAELLPALTRPAHEATPTATATSTPAPTAAPTATPTDRPEPTATPTAPALISEVLAETSPPNDPPPASIVRGGSYLPLPDGVTVVWGGCASDGECHPYNFYWAPTHEVVMQSGEAQYKVEHELCHAHQHWSISGGAPLAPSDYDLESWYATAEGQSFAVAVAGLPWPWTHSAVNPLEDFAWTCAYWYVDPAYLLQVSPQHYAWAEANLP